MINSLKKISLELLLVYATYISWHFFGTLKNMFKRCINKISN